jgi:hypothetical protein
MKGSWLVTGLIGIWLVGNLVVSAIPPLVEIPSIVLVLFGGLRFLLVNGSRMTFDIPAVILGGGASVVFVLLAHWLFRGFARQRPGAGPWKWRWTLAVLGTVVLMFTAGVSLVGLAHQSLWLAGSSQPMYEKVLGGRHGRAVPKSREYDLKTIGLGIEDSRILELREERLRLLSWETRILPYLNYYAEGLKIDQPWNSPENRPVFKKPIAEFLNPNFTSHTWFNQEGYALSHLAANERVIGPRGVARQSDIKDGLAETILIGEVNANFEPWGKPENWRDPAGGLNQSPTGFGGTRGSGVVYFVMADGSVRALRADVDPQILKALATPNGGEWAE